MIDKGSFDVMIEVDGGIDTENAAQLIQKGVNVLVAGNTIFSSKDPAGTILKLKLLS
jgi:ribulose-phosphate 3-epimerase